MGEHCKHCGERIERSYSDYNHGWRHVSTQSVWCQLTMADTEPGGSNP